MYGIYLIVGPSGVGKSTLETELKNRLGTKAMESYTTRPPRFNGEKGHIFVTDEQYDSLQNIIGEVMFDGYRYCTTADLIDSCDTYVIEPSGVLEIQKHYHGKKNVVVIGLTAERNELVSRMRKRGASMPEIERRLANDAKFFTGDYAGVIDYDFMVHADGIPETADAVAAYIQFREKQFAESCMVSIYQVKVEERNRAFLFANAEALTRFSEGTDKNVHIDMSRYSLVWHGTLESIQALAPRSVYGILDTIYMVFNMSDRPSGQTMRSVSVSDIVRIERNRDKALNGSWFCDSFGWRKIE